jgi:hypothetical protein
MSTNNSMLPKASDYVIQTMSELANYARLLSHYRDISVSQKTLFLLLANGLENTRDKWANGRGRCLSRADLGVLLKFGNLLTRQSIDQYFTHHSIYDKLPKFWSNMCNIPDSAVAEVITGRPVSDQPRPPLDLEKVNAAKLSSSLMIKTVIDRNNSGNNNMLLLDIPAVLLTIIIRSEAHEHTLTKILQRTGDGTKGQVDIAELLSVTYKQPKMKKGHLSFVPDMRAIRDATAHAKFTIENDTTGDFTVHFRNTEYGYSFHKTFSRIELLHFYLDYDRMTIIYSRLLIIRSLYSYLNSYFSI